MRNSKLLQAILLGASLGLSQFAGAVAVGPNTGVGPSLETDLDLVGSVWVAGGPDPLDHIEISADPGAGLWIKTLGPVVAGLGGTRTIHEYLVVGPGPAWTDWHEEILTDGWVWDIPPTPLVQTGGEEVPGLNVMTSADKKSVWFTFDPLLPGTEVFIAKNMQCVLLECSGSITVAEYPTVPLPAAVWLFGSGLFGLIGIARRKAS